MAEDDLQVIVVPADNLYCHKLPQNTLTQPRDPMVPTSPHHSRSFHMPEAISFPLFLSTTISKNIDYSSGSIQCDSMTGQVIRRWQLMHI